MNKKGFLLGEETVKLILAVIAIIFLVVFIVYLYNNFTQNKELDQAKSSLDHLISEISSGSTEVEIFNPKDWILSSWLSSEAVLIPGASNMPKQCLTNKWDACLCLCAAPGGAVKSLLVACDTNGICKQNDFSVKDGELDLGKNFPLVLSINQQSKTIEQRE